MDLNRNTYAEINIKNIKNNVEKIIQHYNDYTYYIGVIKADCYGYDWNKETKQLEINKEQAEVVRMIFNWYIEGLGCRRIANKLEEMKIPSYTGARWSTSSIISGQLLLL